MRIMSTPDMRITASGLRLAEEDRSDVEELTRDVFAGFDSLHEFHFFDSISPERRHSAPVAGLDHLDRLDAKAGGEYAVAGRGCAATLNVAEDGHPGLAAREPLELLAQDRAHAPQPHVAEGVGLARSQDGFFGSGVPGELGAFADHNDREVLPSFLATRYQLGHLFDGQGALGDQDGVGTAGYAGHHGDPAGMAAHDLYHHSPVVRLSGGVQPVDGLGGHADRGVEAEGIVGAGKIVVYGLGHAHDLQAEVTVPLHGHAQSVLAADRQHRVDPLGLDVLHDLLGTALLRERVGPAGA